MPLDVEYWIFRIANVLSPYDGSGAAFLLWRGGRLLDELRSDQDNRVLIWKRRNHRQVASHRSDRALYGREPGSLRFSA